MFLLFCIIEHRNVTLPCSKLLWLSLLLQKLLEIRVCLLISGPFPFCLLSLTPRLPPSAFPVLGLRGAEIVTGWGGGTGVGVGSGSTGWGLRSTEVRGFPCAEYE